MKIGFARKKGGLEQNGEVLHCSISVSDSEPVKSENKAKNLAVILVSQIFSYFLNLVNHNFCFFFFFFVSSIVFEAIPSSTYM
jgi:hypothetical protein